MYNHFVQPYSQSLYYTYTTVISSVVSISSFMEFALTATTASFLALTRTAFSLIRYVLESTRLLKIQIRLMLNNTYVCDVWLIQMHFDYFNIATTAGLIWSAST